MNTWCFGMAGFHSQNTSDEIILEGIHILLLSSCSLELDHIEKHWTESKVPNPISWRRIFSDSNQVVVFLLKDCGKDLLRSLDKKPV